MVPQRYEQDKSLGIWVSKQRALHKTNKFRLDRKRILDGIEFAWKADDAYRNFKPDDKLWHEEHQKLVKFKGKNGHCMVPRSYEQDKTLGRWVSTQRKYHNKNIVRPDRKGLLDETGFAWKAVSLAAPSVRGVAIGSFYALGR
jgi:hypothetical protein